MKIQEILSSPIYWEMTNSEKIALFSLLSEIKPSISIEIGTKEGGSLQLISHFSKKVYSIDIDQSVKKLEDKFNNVEFLIGDSLHVLPTLLINLEQKGEYPDFIFIDGNHSTEGVMIDIVNALKTKVTKKLHILMHDSFNPDCRKGMLQVDYSSNKSIQFVDIDFVNGIYSPSVSTKSEMWGGFGLIILDSNELITKPIIRKSSEFSYQMNYTYSTHFLYKPQNILQKIKSYLFRKLYM